MTGYDANGWEREPFEAQPDALRRNIRNPEYETDGAAQYQKPAPRPLPCAECLAGKGTTQPGPPHCRTHGRHCSAEACW